MVVEGDEHRSPRTAGRPRVMPLARLGLSSVAVDSELPPSTSSRRAPHSRAAAYAVSPHVPLPHPLAPDELRSVGSGGGLSTPVPRRGRSGLLAGRAVKDRLRREQTDTTNQSASQQDQDPCSPLLTNASTSSPSALLVAQGTQPLGWFQSQSTQRRAPTTSAISRQDLQDRGEEVLRRIDTAQTVGSDGDLQMCQSGPDLRGQKNKDPGSLKSLGARSIVSQPLTVEERHNHLYSALCQISQQIAACPTQEDMRVAHRTTMDEIGTLSRQVAALAQTCGSILSRIGESPRREALPPLPVPPRRELRRGPNSSRTEGSSGAEPASPGLPRLVQSISAELRATSPQAQHLNVLRERGIGGSSQSMSSWRRDTGEHQVAKAASLGDVPNLQRGESAEKVPRQSGVSQSVTVQLEPPSLAQTRNVSAGGLSVASAEIEQLGETLRLPSPWYTPVVQFLADMLDTMLLPVGTSAHDEDPDVVRAVMRIKMEGLGASCDNPRRRDRRSVASHRNSTDITVFQLQLFGHKVLLPDCRFRILWDFVYLTAVLWETCTFILAIAVVHGTGHDAPPFVWQLRVVLTVYWLADLWVQAHTCRLEGYDMVDDPDVLRQQYTRQRLPIDLLMSLPYSLVLHLAGASTKLVWWFAAAQVPRLGLRVQTLFRLSSPILETPIWADAIRMLFWTAVLVHLIACMWVGIVHEEDWGDWWERVSPEKGTYWDMYSTAVYLTVTTMTSVGYGDISPVKEGARWLNIAMQFVGVMTVMLIGGRTGAYFVLTDPFQLMALERRRRLSSLMKNQGIPWSIQREAFTIYPVLLEAGMLDYQEGLQELPDFVAERISRHIKLRLLVKVPLFREVSKTVLTHLAESLHEETIGGREYIIRAGDPGNEMYFITHGVVEVLLPGEGADGIPEEVWTANLKAGSWFGEIALVQETTRVASIRTLTPCALYRLDRPDFEYVVAGSAELRKVIQKETARRLNKVKEVQEEAGHERENDSPTTRQRRITLRGPGGRMRSISPSAGGGLGVASASDTSHSVGRGSPDGAPSEPPTGGTPSPRDRAHDDRRRSGEKDQFLFGHGSSRGGGIMPQVKTTGRRSSVIHDSKSDTSPASTPRSADSGKGAEEGGGRK
eukprot:TRINITY_DN7914_c2_g1_i2.p1 TRINITY_DN7914_c2_g1~~TRINITY_DN7914_c2_g1_i2.p1  ORF type:complete len:1122 (+),score=260.98 TRINITY_DN7914_c2_g1_i2:81-3446(+)